MDLKLEQKANIKLCVKLGKSATETLEMRKQAYGNEAMSRRGRTSLEDDERSGQPSTSTTPKNVEESERIVRQDRRITIKEVADIVNMSFGTVHAILTSDLSMHRVAAKFLPRLLNPDQKQHRVGVCEEVRQQTRDDPTFTSRIITGDESWVYGYDPETKQQSSQWKRPHSPRPKKARQVRSATKSMLVVFFDIREIVHREFVLQGHTLIYRYTRECSFNI
ncbi:protein GVQW3-like [Gigantopelta aegis]|uniref:protein GVQW3-like n=1 Tax=Gigantopelta aegis TaxID=1735272 RepID=UPI001B88D1B1|nr:protein GVQW3-like [Gigantopelta aegis]